MSVWNSWLNAIAASAFVRRLGTFDKKIWKTLQQRFGRQRSMSVLECPEKSLHEEHFISVQSALSRVLYWTFDQLSESAREADSGEHSDSSFNVLRMSSKPFLEHFISYSFWRDFAMLFKSLKCLRNAHQVPWALWKTFVEHQGVLVFIRCFPYFLFEKFSAFWTFTSKGFCEQPRNSYFS